MTKKNLFSLTIAFLMGTFCSRFYLQLEIAALAISFLFTSDRTGVWLLIRVIVGFGLSLLGFGGTSAWRCSSFSQER